MPYWGAFFGKPIRIAIPTELADEAALLAYLGLGAAELRKIWYYRGRMYRHFSIAKGTNKVRMISAPDDRLKFLQRKLADKLTELYRPRKPVHGFVAERSVKTNALAHVPAASWMSGVWLYLRHPRPRAGDHWRESGGRCRD